MIIICLTSGEQFSSWYSSLCIATIVCIVTTSVAPIQQFVNMPICLFHNPNCQYADPIQYCLCEIYSCINVTSFFTKKKIYACIGAYIFNIGTYSDPYSSIGTTLVTTNSRGS